MLILFIQNDLPPDHFGGSEILTLTLARKFSERGAQITILTRKLQNNKPIKKINGVSIVRIGIPFDANNRSLFFKFIWLISFILSGCIQCAKIKPDVIHSQTRIPGGIVSGIARLLTPASSFLSIHSNLEALDNFEKFLTIFALKINPNIIVPTKLSEKQVTALSSSRISVIPNAINFYNTPEKKEELNNNILFVGRLHPIKGIELAIKALKVVKSKNFPFQFNIIGNGQEKSYLMKLVQDLNLTDNISFHGYVSEEGKATAYRNASYFLLPSLSECFPISILEAINAGLYVLASHVGGIPEMLEYGKYGKLFPSNDVTAIADTIESVFSQKNSQKLRRITRAFRFAKSRYNLNVVVDKYFNCYFRSFQRSNPLGKKD